MGLFAGSRPAGLGVSDGKLAEPNQRPNNVHSQIATDDLHYVAPIAPQGDVLKAFKKLKALVGEMPKCRVVTERDDYLYVEFSSPIMGFVDDTEFYLEPKRGLIHARAAARLGIRDFGANRGRIEDIRARLAAAGH